MSERDQFEAWWERAHNNGKLPRFGWQHWRSGDGYLVDDDETEFQWRWEAWQASREALKDEQPVTDAWISCADRMPNEGDLVTVCDHGIDVYPAVFSNGEFYEYSDRIMIEESTRMSNPTHWMRLPSPPSQPHPIDTTSQQYEALSKGESK